jgi:hypothetical protein
MYWPVGAETGQTMQGAGWVLPRPQVAPDPHRTIRASKTQGRSTLRRLFTQQQRGIQKGLGTTLVSGPASPCCLLLLPPQRG